MPATPTPYHEQASSTSVVPLQPSWGPLPPHHSSNDGTVPAASLSSALADYDNSSYEPTSMPAPAYWNSSQGLNQNYRYFPQADHQHQQSLFPDHALGASRTKSSVPSPVVSEMSTVPHPPVDNRTRALQAPTPAHSNGNAPIVLETSIGEAVQVQLSLSHAYGYEITPSALQALRATKDERFSPRDFLAMAMSTVFPHPLQALLLKTTILFTVRTVAELLHTKDGQCTCTDDDRWAHESQTRDAHHHLSRIYPMDTRLRLQVQQNRARYMCELLRGSIEMLQGMDSLSDICSDQDVQRPLQCIKNSMRCSGDDEMTCLGSWVKDNLLGLLTEHMLDSITKATTHSVDSMAATQRSSAAPGPSMCHPQPAASGSCSGSTDEIPSQSSSSENVVPAPSIAPFDQENTAIPTLRANRDKAHREGFYDRSKHVLDDHLRTMRKSKPAGQPKRSPRKRDREDPEVTNHSRESASGDDVVIIDAVGDEAEDGPVEMPAAKLPRVA